MERAFENAAKSLSYGHPPADDEMRLYAISKSISKELRKAERPHEDTIIRQIKERTELWVECKKISES